MNDDYGRTLTFEQMVRATNAPVDRAMTGMALREARRYGLYREVLQIALAKRAEHRRWHTRTQRKWQAGVSRRPQRGRHHDSWRIRESYVRVHNSPDA